MSTRLLPVVFVLAMGAFHVRAEPAIPQSLPQTVDLATVVNLAKERSPRMRVERHAIAQAEAERIGAAALPNPTISYGRMRHGGGASTVFDGSRQQDMSIEIPLWLADQRAARMARTERDIEAARARVEAGASNLATEAGAAYAALWAAQERSKTMAAAVEEARRLSEIVDLREKSGMASRYDVARILVEMGALRARAEDAKADVIERSGALAALLGFAGWFPAASGGFDGAIGALDAAVPPDLDTVPQAIVAAREEEAARSAVEQARRERLPVPSISLGRTWTSDPFGAANVIGFSVEVPLLDGKRGPLEKARVDAQAAALRRDLVRAEVAANVERLRTLAASRQKARLVFEKEASERVGQVRQMSEDAYQLGRASLLDLLDAARARLDVELMRIDMAVAAFEPRIRLLGLLGRL